MIKHKTYIIISVILIFTTIITGGIMNNTIGSIFDTKKAHYQPFVPTRSFWDKIYDRKDLPSINNWLTLGSSKMESATEDKAAILTLIDNIKSHDKTFILHELVYGHFSRMESKNRKDTAFLL